MSKRKQEKQAELTAAAEALEAELQKFERLVESAGKVSLDSQKNLETVAQALSQVTGCDERLGAHLGALVAAIQTARERHQASVDRAQAIANSLRGRTEAYQGLLESYGALGKTAAGVNLQVQQLAARKREGAGAEKRADLLGQLEEVIARMGQATEEARALEVRASQENFVDVARQAEALRQQLLSARNKMGLLQKSL